MERIDTSTITLAPGSRSPAGRGTRSAQSQRPRRGGERRGGGGVIAFNGSRSERGRDGRRGGEYAGRGRRGDYDGSRNHRGDYAGRGRGGHRGGHRGGYGQYYDGYASPYYNGAYDRRPDFRNRYGIDYYGGYYGSLYSPRYRYNHYRGYRRCYGYGGAYYRPYYYPRWYDYGGGYVGIGIYDTPVVYQDVEVVYTDPVVRERQVVTEPYYGTPPTESQQSYVDPNTGEVMGTMTRIEPATPDTATIVPQAEGGSTEDATEASPSPAPPLVEKGNEAMRAGRYEEARGWHARAMLADEQDGFAKLFYAMSNLGLGQFDVAASAMRRALMDAPELIDYPIDLRTVYEDASVMTKQMQDLIRVRSERGSDAELTFLLGYLYYATGDPQSAVSTLSDLATGDSTDTLAGLVRDAAIRVQTPPEESKSPSSAEKNKT